MKTNIFKIITHYPKDAIKFDGTEYSGVDVFFNDILLIHCGDYYHDKGQLEAMAYARGFIRGAKAFGYDFKYEFVYENVADV